MNSVSAVTDVVSVSVENVGGIDATTAEIPPGVTVLVGRNATNRTSFLKALLAGLGSEHVPLKAGADEGNVTLTIDGNEYTRTVRRTNGTLVTGGNPYADSPTAAERFAFHLESNAARRAVALDGDLRDIVLDPVDVADLEADVRELERRRDALDATLQRREELEHRARELESERRRLDEELSDLREQLADREATLQTLREESDDANETTVEDVQRELESIRYDIETVEEGMDALQEEYEEKQSELADLRPVEDPADLDETIAAKRRERQRLESQLGDLQRVVQFNRERLESEDRLIETSESGPDPAGRLLGDQTVCWTCGSTVETDQVRDTIDQLRAFRQEVSERRDAIEAELSELRERRETLEKRREHANTLESRIDEIESELTRREERRDSLRERERELVSRLPDSAEGRTDPGDDLLQAQAAVTRTEARIERLESERESVLEDLESIADRLDELADAERRRESVATELTEKRETIANVERATVERFNESMDTVLDILGYENVERIWMERLVHDDATELVADATFSLHVVRDRDGTVHEDTVSHLSESEREITGLIFALAGYLAHEVYADMPFVVLDSLEAIDSERIATLLEYVSQFAPYLVVALLPEDAQHVDADQRITDI